MAIEPTLPGQLRAVGSADGHTWIAVGDGGVILRSSDSARSWTAVASGTSAALRRLWMGSNEAIAVGATGTILFSDDIGAHFGPIAAPTTDDITAVWAAPSSDVFAVSGANVLHARR